VDEEYLRGDFLASTPVMQHSVEVLIPHYNGGEDMRRALDALRDQTTRPMVCVIDNGSTDDSVEMLARDYPEVRVLELGENLGYSVAVNAGAKTSGARLIVVLNDDAIADPEFIETILSVQDRTGAEMVAACLRSPDGKVESLGVEVDRALNPYDACHGDAYTSKLDARPLGPCGGAAAYLRDAFEGLGGFDETIFIYYEDVDLAIRMRIAGMTCAPAPKAFVWHEHSATVGARTSRKNELLGFARGYLLWKYGRNLTLRERAVGIFTDTIVYAGKAAIDRNIGAFQGRLRVKRAIRDLEQPDQDPRFDDLPLLQLSLRESLARRLLRRR
jgi:N-acetylglucosaminyl-diphospho-decaprenol L-rhamnosyltransferase